MGGGTEQIHPTNIVWKPIQDAFDYTIKFSLIKQQKNKSPWKSLHMHIAGYYYAVWIIMLQDTAKDGRTIRLRRKVLHRIYKEKEPSLEKAKQK